MMEYQQLPPVSMIIGSPNSVPHVHAMNGNNNANGNGNGNNHISSNQLLTMQPPLLPLQVAHNLHQLTTHNSQSNSVHHGSNQNQSSQSLPPTAQLLQAIHNNTQQQQPLQQQNMSSNTNGTVNNNTNSVNNDENNRWTQYQVQQLWRHHAYLNGKVKSGERTSGFFTKKRPRLKALKHIKKKNFRKEISKLHNDSEIYK